jgi:uncharacterized protein (TIGR02453 family)
MATSSFAGFPQATFAFLRGVAANNNKVWFDAHRADYEAGYVEPGKAFVEAIGPGLKKISPSVKFEPRVNGSLFRINRDVRFAKDKSPYQTKLDLWFWHGGERGWTAPGFFLRIEADKIGIGVGMHVFQKPQLDAFRHAVLDGRSGKALEKVIAKVEGAGPYRVHGATRKTVPRGFDADHERAKFLLHEGLWTDIEVPSVAEAKKPEFVKFCLGHFAAMWPIGRWLLDEVTAG